MRMMQLCFGLAVAVVLSATFNASAMMMLVDLEPFEHGRILTDQIPGLTITAVNHQKPFDLAVVFDTRQRGTADPDLEGPNLTGGTWAAGNIAPDEILGNLLIIQENNIGANTGIVTYPDDEGTAEPTGKLWLAFDTPLHAFGFDLVDIDGPDEWTDAHGYVAFWNDGVQVGRISWGDFINPASAFYIPGMAFGDNSANRIAPIYAAMFHVDTFDTIEFDFYSSGAIGNFTTVIPEPASLALVILGGLMLLRPRTA